MNIKSLSRTFVLELIESILANNAGVFGRHPEHAQVLRHRLMPLTVRYLSERHTFSITVRVARILHLILRHHIPLMIAESEMALALLIHLIDTDMSVPWKRVLCMEIFRALYTEPGLISEVYRLFDEQDGRKNILRDHMACLVRLASEKPSLIGVGQQSTIPTGQGSNKDTFESQGALESVGVPGVMGGSSSSSEVYGISSQWSLVRIPYLETLDKLDSPSPPDTYIYSLVLNCINAFSETLAKFIIPLTVTESKGKRRRPASRLSKEGDELIPTGPEHKNSSTVSKKSSVPLNPLELTSHQHYDGIKTCAGIIETCWPAVLATSSTFLYAALDSDYYHNLVRAFQKLAHVAGLMRLSTPRDAFLTTLGKAAIPPDRPLANSSGSALSPGPDPIPKSPSASDLTSSPIDAPISTLSPRNLLCLRALLNLGIALGPTLDRDAWSIILETLQHAELLLSATAASSSTPIQAEHPTEKNPLLSPETSKSNISTEIFAVQTAANKMFESTGDYPNDDFKTILVTLLALSESTKLGTVDSSNKRPTSPIPPQPGRQVGRIHQTKRSISIALGRTRVQEDELNFVLEKINEIAKSNIPRLSQPQDDERIWDILVDNLVEITRSNQIGPPMRSKAADILNRVVLHTVKLTDSVDEKPRNEVQLRGLRALKSQIITQYGRLASRSMDLEIHDAALETLKSVLEGSGQSIVAGWDLVFDLISSVFEGTSSGTVGEETAIISPRAISSKQIGPPTVRSPKLVRTAFDSLQLVASDFISLLPATCLLDLIKCFSCFASQAEDFNISLTTTTFFWNISDFLRKDIDGFTNHGQITADSEEKDIINAAKSSDHSTSRNALWLLLLLNIVDLTADDRREVRNGAIQMILRILDHYGEQLSADAWHICLNKALLAMAEAVHLNSVRVSKADKSPSDGTKSWIDTAILLVKGLASLIASFFDTIVKHGRFHDSWSRLLRNFEAMMKTDSLELKGSIFTSFTEILSSIRSYGETGLDSLQAAWSVWADGNPVSNGGKCDDDHSNQEALLAYLQTYQQLYRLLKTELGESHISQTLNNFEIAIKESIPSKYSHDLENQSELQAFVIECLRTLCIDKPSFQVPIISCLSKFFNLPLTYWSPQPARGKPSYVAFSKTAIGLFDWYIAENGMQSGILSNHTLNDALDRLSSPLLNKYIWPGKDSSPTLWQTATTVSCNILRIAIPYVENQYESCDRAVILRFWESVLSIVKGVLSCGDYTELNITPSAVLSDELFDIAAFERLKGIIIPSLGSSYVPETVRRDFAFIVFNSSLIYTPKRLDNPTVDKIQREPLKNLYNIQRGCTVDAIPTIRIKISYVLIDTLFNLTSVPDPSTKKHGLKPPSKPAPSPIPLAKAIAPYLILRCALPLKTYISDQPLRGSMPQPVPAREELLSLIRRLVELRSEPSAIPPAGPTVPLAFQDGEEGEKEDGSRYKQHLGWIYPLVVQGMKVASKKVEDNEVMAALAEVLEEIGGTCSF